MFGRAVPEIHRDEKCANLCGGEVEENVFKSVLTEDRDAIANLNVRGDQRGRYGIDFLIHLPVGEV